MTDPFVTHRSLLFTVAYEMLGSAADAEDVVQETWLRWAEADQSCVRDPRAYLVRIVTRQALNRLRTLVRRREDYVGQWLPEPLLTTPDVADVAEDVELAESVSMAMLTVLETLTPTERAVFELREVFELPYEEIATALDRTAAAVRQVAHRARAHVAARRPRMRVDPARRTVEQGVGDAPAAVAGANADAPHRPDGQVIDVGNLRGPCEGQLRSGCDRRPPDDFAVLVGQNARRDLAAAQPPDVLAPGTSDEFAVGLRVDPMTEAPAHRGVRVLGPEYGRDVVEPCDCRGLDLNAYVATLTPGGADDHSAVGPLAGE